MKNGRSIDRFRSYGFADISDRRWARRQQHELSFRYCIVPVELRFQTLAAHVLACFRSKEDKDIGYRGWIGPDTRIFIWFGVAMHGRIQVSRVNPIHPN